MRSGFRWCKLIIVSAGMLLLIGSLHAQEVRDPNKKYTVSNGVLHDVTSPKPLKIDDSLSLDSLGNTIKAPVKSVLLSDTTIKKERVHLLRDSISLSKMCYISAALPGFGQLYNKQVWKIPVIYAVGGASLYYTLKEHNLYKGYKNQYNTLIYESASREVLDQVQTKMIQHNTRKQIFMMGFIATYIYQVGDAALNYKWQTTAVKKATTLSTILPGAGQFYNRSYWKVPIVLGGIATMAFVIDWNNRGYNRFKLAYDLRYAATQNKTESKDEFNGLLSLDGIREWKNNYRRNRDLCIIISGGLYLLNVVEANVDASLKDYDISDMLAMEIEPRIINYSMLSSSGNAVGLGINIRF